MNHDVFSTFYHSLLPHFSPRTEGFIANLKPQDLHHSSFRYIFSVRSMIEISHLIEDSVIETSGVADTHVSFQYYSRIAAQAEQYQRVAKAARQLWLYGVPDAPLPKWPRTIGVSTSGTPLEKYWFVVAYGAGLYATLLAEEIDAGNGQRLYEGFFTFEPETAYQVIRLLHQMYPVQIPEPVSPKDQEG